MRRLITNACVCCCALALSAPAQGDEGRPRLSVRRLNLDSAPISVDPGSSSAARIVTSQPPLGAIDARVPSAGWTEFTLGFDRNVSGLTVANFSLMQVGGERAAPHITSIQHVDASTIRVLLDGPAQPGAWTIIKAASGEARFGFLPGDVNGDGTVNGRDLLTLADAVNGAVELPLHSADIDRSGELSRNDFGAGQALFNGTIGGRARRDASLGPRAKGSDPVDDGDIQLGTQPELEVGFEVDYNGDGCANAGTTVPVRILVRRLQAGSPIAIRGLQVDVRQTDADLEPVGSPVSHSAVLCNPGPCQDLFFWDFDSQTICGIDEGECGFSHFIVGSEFCNTVGEPACGATTQPDLTTNPLLSITYTSLSGSNLAQLFIPGDTTSLVAGSFDITAPGAAGSYKLDVVNGLEKDVNLGFYVVFGFGVSPTDPVTTWRVNTGQVIGGSLPFQVCGGAVCDPPDCNDDVDCTVDECVEGACVNTPDNEACDDGLTCTTDLCDPETGCVNENTCPAETPFCTAGGCVECVKNTDCTGGEICQDGNCVVPMGCEPPNCDDGIACTLDVCVDNMFCQNTPDNAACDDGLFCNGPETCHIEHGCVPGVAPCAGELVCNEANDTCVECLTSEDCAAGETCEDNECVPEGCTTPEQCSDGKACNGVETCNTATGECLDGTPVQCDEGEVCTEPNGTCVEVGDNKISIVPDQSCYFWGEVVTVDIVVAAEQNIVGGQFFLTYNPEALDFVSAQPVAPWTVEIFEEVNEPAGLIDYAVHVPFPPPGVGASSGTMARLRFMAIQDFCGPTEIECRDHNPPTRITPAGGLDITPPCNPGHLEIVDPMPLQCPDDLEVNADAGGCTAHVCFKDPMGGGECEPPATGGLDCVAMHGTTPIPLDEDNCADYPAGETTITCSGNGGGCDGGGGGCVFTITVSDQNTFTSEVQLSPIVQPTSFDRCITWEIYPADCGEPVVIEAVLSFGLPQHIPGHGVLEGKLPCGDYECIAARDQLHTLRSVISAEIIDEDVDLPGYNFSRKIWSFVFKGDPLLGGSYLIGGNLNDDCVIDILDFGVFIEQYGTDYGTGDTTCETEFPHADVNGDGVVDVDDYDFIAGNFLTINKQNCCDVVAEGCSPPGDGGRGAAALVIDTKGRVISTPATHPMLQRADLNGDGVLDLTDLGLFELGVRPAPKAKARSRVFDDRHAPTMGMD